MPRDPESRTLNKSNPTCRGFRFPEGTRNAPEDADIPETLGLEKQSWRFFCVVFVCIVALSARNPLSLRSIHPMKKRSFVPEPTSAVYHTNKRSFYNEWSRLPCVKPLACWCPKCCHTANENAAPSESICSARVYTVPGIPPTCLCGRPARRRWQDWLSKTCYVDSGTHLSSVDGAGCAAQVSIAARAAT